MDLIKSQSNSIQFKNQSGYPISKIIALFKSSPYGKANYPRVAKKYLQFTIENNLDINQLSYNIYVKDKSSNIKTPIHKLWLFCNESGIEKALKDKQKTHATTAYNKLFLKYINTVMNVHGLRTKDTKLNGLNAFEKYRSDRGLYFNATTVNDFIFYLKHEKELSPFTINSYLSSVKSLTEWILRNPEIAVPEKLDEYGELSDSFKKNMYQIKNVSGLSMSFTKEHFSREHLPIHLKENFYKRVNNIEHKAYISCLLHCGMRISEPSSIRLEDLDFKKMLVSIKAKGKSKRGQVMIFEPTAEAIRKHIEINQVSQGKLFKITPSAVRKIINSIYAEMGIKTKGMVAHSLRHTAAHSMIKAGYSEYIVQKQLNHTDVHTTRIYVGEELKNSFYTSSRRDI